GEGHFDIFLSPKLMPRVGDLKMGKIVTYPIAVFFTVFLSISSASAANVPVLIMPLGDSITYGSSSGVKPGEEVSYRKALRDKLVAAGYEIVFVGSQDSGKRILPNSSHEGHRQWCASGCQQNRSDPPYDVYNFLASNPPDIVLLHIGTNDIIAGRDPQEIVSAVSGILDNIFRYASDHNRQIRLILALIINQLNPPCLNCAQTTAYNKALRQMAQDRIQKGDKLILVDMEKDAGIDYRLTPAGDMAGIVHPSEKGYQKMATVWFEGLKQVLTPSGDNIQKDFRASPTDPRKDSDGEKGAPSPSPATQTSAPPFLPAPTPPAQPPAISAKEPEPALPSKPTPAEEPKAAKKKEPPSDSQLSQPADTKGYAIQVNAFRDLILAEEFVETQKKRGHQVYVSKMRLKDQGVWYRVYLGRFADKAEAARYMKEKKIRDSFPNCFIQKLP
ncbi:MAG: putative lysophospholipase, partial [Deltaproteobacteria bacterium]|nr:putative lysophospholipase [Deltaproteobacteria bacterium]